MNKVNEFVKNHINKIKVGIIIADYYHYYDLDKNIIFNDNIYYNNIDLIINKKRYGRTRNDSKFSDSYNMYRNDRISISTNSHGSNNSLIELDSEQKEDEWDYNIYLNYIYDE